MCQDDKRLTINEHTSRFHVFYPGDSFTGTQGWEDVGGRGHDGWCRIGFDMEARYNPWKSVAGTTQRPCEVGVIGIVNTQQFSISGHHFGTNDAVR